MTEKRSHEIPSDPYAGEVMNIQREDDGTFYVEIPELDNVMFGGVKNST